jgi:hypothetical protein
MWLPIAGRINPMTLKMTLRPYLHLASGSFPKLILAGEYQGEESEAFVSDTKMEGGTKTHRSQDQ